MTEEDVQRLLDIPDKVIIQPMQWIRESGGHRPPWMLFESGIKIGNEIIEGLLFRARYRSSKAIKKGAAYIETGENFNVALFANQTLRVAAIDTDPGQRHINRVGMGKPYFGKMISSDTHRHIWTGDYGYAEPIEPPIKDVVKLIELFALECKITFRGSIVHPLMGEQGELI